MSEDRLPLFPLGIVLLPGEPVPLHIFEPRYKEMVTVCLDGDQPFGIIYASESGLADVGCTARIRRVSARYTDGRLDILVVGEERFTVECVHRDLAYLTAETRPVEDRPADADDRPTVRQRVIARHMKLLELAGEDPVTAVYDADPLSFAVGRNAGLDLDGKQRLLAMDLEPERLAFLARHLGRLLVQVRRARQLRDLARGDGHADGFPEIGPG